MYKKVWIIMGATMLILLLLNTQVGLAHEERSDGYFTFLNPENDVIFQTAIVVSVGDEFIAEDNSHYRVTTIKGDDVSCEYLGVATPPDKITTQPSSNWRLPFSAWVTQRVVALRQPTIAIYHTHSDESYVPTDGSASIYGDGGIFKVGSAFGNALHKLSFNIVHDTTPHDPHDAMSYTRSRRTAAELLKRRPAALFDIHRDAVPRELYVASVKGEDVAKLTLVVGRENPKIKANLNFAKQLKEINDKENPGLIKGIFLAQGGYNQDLFDRALLIEAGTHENSRPAAEKGISLFAATIPQTVGGTQGVKPSGRTQATKATQITGSWSAVGWILLLVIIGGALYLYLSTGSWQELGAKVKRFARQELNELGPRKKDSDDRP